MRRIGLGLAAALLVGTTSLRGQRPVEVVSAGLTAYRALEYDRAAELFRQGLTAGGSAALDDSARSAAWLYLGAAHLFRGRRDSAVTAFRAALASNPRCRPDSLIFPPEVGTTFEGVRRATAFVSVVVPSDTTVPPGGAYVIRLYSSAPHRAMVQVVGPDVVRPRPLFTGVLVDSVTVRWAARDPFAAMPPEGTVMLEVTSRPDSAPPRSFRLPLVLSEVVTDTSALPRAPASPVVNPPMTSRSGGLRFGVLAAGLVAGGAIVLVPKLFSVDAGGTGTRVAVGGALGLAGVIGFLGGRGQRTEPVTDPRHGPEVAAWRRAVDSTHADNERRAHQASIRIRTVGAPRIGP